MILRSTHSPRHVNLMSQSTTLLELCEDNRQQSTYSNFLQLKVTSPSSLSLAAYCHYSLS